MVQKSLYRRKHQPKEMVSDHVESIYWHGKMEEIIMVARKTYFGVYQIQTSFHSKVFDLLEVLGIYGSLDTNIISSKLV